jgi:hypothetical protein
MQPEMKIIGQNLISFSFHSLLKIMFLSMYVSFRLSGDTEHEHMSYVLLMAGFMIVVSLLSTFVSMFWLWIILLYPFWLVSFPFYSIPKLSFGDWGYLTGYNINFFGMEIMSVSPQNVLVYGFLFFLLINLVGVIFGYWINQKLSEESLKRELFDFFFRSGILSFFVCYGIILLGWFALGLVTQYEEFVIMSNILLFCRYFFWVPAVIATAIYGIYKWIGMRKERIP